MQYNTEFTILTMYTDNIAGYAEHATLAGPNLPTFSQLNSHTFGAFSGTTQVTPGINGVTLCWKCNVGLSETRFLSLTHMYRRGIHWDQ
jgi:hypothetical protein